MAKWKKTIVAGDLVFETVYPNSSGGSPQARAEKRKLSSEAQARINFKYSWQKLMLILAANFRAGDLVVTLTFDNEHLPDTRSGCATAFKRFRARVKQAYKNARLPEPVIVWTMENKHGDGRWHVHAVMTATGKDFKLIAGSWGLGEVQIDRLRLDKEHSYYEGLAKYMCKEYPDKLGQRCWSYTRNALKPERDVQRVPDDTPLTRPHGATVLEARTVRTDYGCYQFLSYLLPGWEDRRGAKAKRTKKRA